jgi:hypothetical protein
MSAATTPQPGEQSYDARLAGCTCAWLRGFGVGEVKEEWGERIIERDPQCRVPHKT